MNPDVQPAFAIWITGLPASGKLTVTNALLKQLRGTGLRVSVLESDPLRQLFSKNPEYDERDREYFYVSLAFIGRVLIDNGIAVIFDATANRRSYRDRARAQISRFIEVFVDCPLEICSKRDPKGIYRLAREGKASHVPGLQAVYEPPEHPDIVIHSDRDPPEDAAQRIVELLKARGFLRTA